MGLLAANTEQQGYAETSVFYYRKALKAISLLLEDPDSAQSDELLAASVILSTYVIDTPCRF